MITKEFRAACELAKQETNQNHHTDSLLIISYHMISLGPDSSKKVEKIAASLEAVKLIHEAYGYMIPNLGALRSTLADDLSDAVREEYGNEAIDLMNKNL